MPVPAVESAENPDLTATSAPSAPTVDAWAPARLLLRNALKRLEDAPEPSAVFLQSAVSFLSAIDPNIAATESFSNFSSQVHDAIKQRRPGIPTGSPWADVAEDT